jgi:site-specific DNA recombinase
MARWFIFGDGDRPPLTILEISRRLTELQIPIRADALGRTKQLRGRGEWDARTVGQILRDPALGGTFYANRYQRLSKTEVRLRPREEWTPIPIPAILDADLYAAVQRKLDTGRALAARNNSRRFYLLRCRLRCACGYALCGYGTPSSSNRYYRCISRDRDRTRCDLPYIPTDVLDTRVWAWLQDEALDDNQLQARIEREQDRGAAGRGPESLLARRLN